MRRSKIVPASPTGFPREQDLMFPFPQTDKQEKERSISPRKKPSPPVKKSRTETDHSATITPPPPPLPTSPPLLNGHSHNGDTIRNGHNQQNGLREVISPPLPLPPTPEPASSGQLTGIKSPPPPSPPMQLGRDEDSEVEKVTTKASSDKILNNEKEEQKVRYFIIPSPGPSSTPMKEASPVKLRGKSIRMG